MATNEKVQELLRRIQLWEHTTVTTEHNPQYMYGYDTYGRSTRTPIHHHSTMTITNSKHNVEIKFSYWNINYLEPRLTAINRYLSSLDASADVLGLLDKEFEELKENSKELIECQYLYMHDKPIEAVLAMKWGSKTYVQKQYEAYLAKCEQIQKKKEAIAGKVNADENDVTFLNVTIKHNLIPRYSTIHMNSDFSRYDGNGSEWGFDITDDDLPF